MAYIERMPMGRFGVTATVMKLSATELLTREMRISPEEFRDALDIREDGVYEVRLVYAHGREYAVVHDMADTCLPSEGCSTGCLLTETWCVKGPVLIMGHDRMGLAGLTGLDCEMIRGTAEVWTWRSSEDGAPLDIRVYLRMHDTLEGSLEDVLAVSVAEV